MLPVGKTILPIGGMPPCLTPPAEGVATVLPPCGADVPAEIDTFANGGPLDPLQRLVGGAGSGAALGLSARTMPDYLEGITVRNGRVKHRGRGARLLGQGSLGRVFEHPLYPDVVIKIAYMTFESFCFGQITPAESIAEDALSTATLFKHGLGPRLIWQGKIGGYYVLVKERVHGDTIEDLVYDRKFTGEEYRLFIDLIRKMAEAGITAEDLRLPNFMIGTTASDPVRRAYIVDGNKLLKLNAEMGIEERVEAILRQRVPMRIRLEIYNFRDPISQSFQTLRQLADDGLNRSAEKTFRQRLRRFLDDLFSDANFPQWK